MKRNVVTLLLSSFFTVISAQTNFRPISFDRALDVAYQEDKLVFIDFYTDWCVPCKRMTSKVFPRLVVGEYLNKYYISISTNAETDGKYLAEKYEVSCYPTYVIVNCRGEKIASFSGAMDTEKFLYEIQSLIDHNAISKLNHKTESSFETTKSTGEFYDKIIRWYITSSPQGADLTQRIISSTSNVKNTNSNYIGATPYESTESFDIKGMSYENSSLIQVELKCEKSGYIPQIKRFNLRQLLDQKEISVKFTLTKEE